MEAIHAKGLARNIGVSNWSIKKTEDMLKYAKVVPAVNQVSASCRGTWRRTVLHTAKSHNGAIDVGPQCWAGLKQDHKL